MRKPFIIGKREFKFKKDAIAHYRSILNSYDFGENLNDSDYNDILDLLDFDYLNNLANVEESEIDFQETTDSDDSQEDSLTIDNIKIAKVQFNTKCFEVFFSDGSSSYISYLMMINNKRYTPEDMFYISCRNSIHRDIHSVKQQYFDDNSIKGQVKCQETGVLSMWAELVLDHRQPNTFSIIVDRFKELNRVDLNSIEYMSNEQNHMIFKDEKITKSFRDYHKEKASLRIIRKECNSGRSGMARVKRNSKDLTVK